MTPSDLHATQTLPLEEPIHTYANGVVCWERSIYPGALARCRRFVNIHEPFQEVIFKSVICQPNINGYINIGTGWGYYLILARLLCPEIKIVGIEGNAKMLDRTKRNLSLNKIYNVTLYHAWISSNSHGNSVTLDELLEGRIVTHHNLLSADIEGDAGAALCSANTILSGVDTLLLGTHLQEHSTCLNVLRSLGEWEILLAIEPGEIPLQPDGLIWARRFN